MNDVALDPERRCAAAAPHVARAPQPHSVPTRLSLNAGKATRAPPGQRAIPAEMDQQNGLPHDPFEPAQLQGSSRADKATAQFRGHVAMDAYAPADRAGESVDPGDEQQVEAAELRVTEELRERRQRTPPASAPPDAAGAPSCLDADGS